jgi:uncharacterized protein (DUF305 family)
MTIALVAIASGCAGAGRDPAQASPQPASRYPHTEADVRFMSAMIGHHTQGLVMARLASTHGASAAVRRLAERILNGQQDEIASMRQWLADRGLPLPRDNQPEHAHRMPGMLTGAQMKELADARGPAFDRLFLTYMIQHHRGAVTMVRELFATAGAVQDETVFKFASDVQVDQSTEIARMERMLSALPPGEASS